MSTKPTELRIGVPEAFDGSYEKSMYWLHAVQFYLLVNKAVYNNDDKQIAFALSYMTKGSALTWASTFRQSALSGTTFSLGTFADFISKFNTAFKHHNVLRLTRVEANVDSLDEGLLGFLKGRLQRTRYKGDLRGFLKRRRCWGLPQLLLATVGCYEEFKVEGLRGSVHSRVVWRLREIQGEQSRFKLKK